jgi:hypothetical protein
MVSLRSYLIKQLGWTSIKLLLLYSLPRALLSWECSGLTYDLAMIVVRQLYKPEHRTHNDIYEVGVGDWVRVDLGVDDTENSVI